MNFQDIKLAYYYLEKALLKGLASFDELQSLFKTHFEELAPEFIVKHHISIKEPDWSKFKKGPKLDEEKRKYKEAIMKEHHDYCHKMRNSFNEALIKDR